MGWIEDAERMVSGVSTVHEKIANDVPKIRRGMVWCKKCGRSQQVNGAECLRSGWPECCGETMTIDSPRD